jgi:hypothetical protein
METNKFKFSVPMPVNSQKKINEMLARLRRRGEHYEIIYELKT